MARARTEPKPAKDAGKNGGTPPPDGIPGLDDAFQRLIKSTPAEVVQAIRDADRQITALEKERSETNAAIRALREGLENRGINRHAFEQMRRYCSMKEAKREGYDSSVVIIRHALDAPIQVELWESPKQSIPPTQH